MAKATNNIWNRYKYKMSGGVLILSCYFLYQALFPVFPDALPVKTLGEFEM